MRILIILGFLASCAAWAQPERPIRIDKREKKEPLTQALEALPDPPQAIAAETARLVFHVSPLSNKGLLSQQIRDALKAIDKANGGATLIKIRAFVAGTGDLRRVQQIVAEDFSEKRRPLPAISTIQVGALPLEGAQVVMEAASLDKKAVNPNGLAFFAARRGASLAESIKPLADADSAMLRVTCFVHSLENAAASRQQMLAAFPGAAVNLLQMTRLGIEPVSFCEGVGRPAAAQAEPVAMRGLAAFVTAPRIVFTGIQMAFRTEDADLRTLADRARRAVESAKGTDVIAVSSYALTKSMSDRVSGLAAQAFAGVPGTHLVLEGLPSRDAAAAIEVIGAAR